MREKNPAGSTAHIRIPMQAFVNSAAWSLPARANADYYLQV